MLSSRIRTPLRLARLPSALRSYSGPSRPSLAPQAALRETEDYFPLSEITPAATGTSRITIPSQSPYDNKPRQIISLPPILPPDAQHENSAAQHELYPSTGAIDAASMIAICLRRKEHIPRAFQIFRQTFADYNAGLRAFPDAELHGKVIEGIMSLAVAGSPHQDKWRARADRLITQWEKGMEGPLKVAMKRSRGLKVYQGWFSGMVQ